MANAPQQTPQIKAINELNELGRSLMEKSLNDPKTPLNAAVSSTTSSNNYFLPTKNLSLNEIQQQKNITTTTIKFQSNEINTITNNADESFAVLNTLNVKLEEIKPGSVAPMNLYEKNNLKVVLHFARDSPFSNIHVVVISATSSNTTNTLKNFSFQAAVPKVRSEKSFLCFKKKNFILIIYTNQSI